MSAFDTFGTQRVGTFDGAIPTFDARYVRDGLTFLQGELEKLDSTILEPLSTTSWPRDMPVRTGGGFMDNVSSIFVDYGTTGADEQSMIGDQTNDIPVMQADFGKEKWKLFIWGHYLDIPYVVKEKMLQVTRNLEETLSKGIHLFYDKSVDKSVYTGLSRYGSTGLINNPGVTRYSVAQGEGGTTAWESKSADEILADVNEIIRKTWEASEYDLSGMANHILLPAKQYAMLVSRKASESGDKSILKYLMENSIFADQGRELKIVPLRECQGAGTGGADRMVAYCNDADRVRMDITVPLRRLPTEVNNLRYRTPFISQFSEVQILYPSTIAYGDGI